MRCKTLLKIVDRKTVDNITNKTKKEFNIYFTSISKLIKKLAKLRRMAYSINILANEVFQCFNHLFRFIVFF